MKPKKTEITITSRIPIELKEKIDDYCAITRVTVMGLVELAIIDYLKRKTEQTIFGYKSYQDTTMKIKSVKDIFQNAINKHQKEINELELKDPTPENEARIKYLDESIVESHIDILMENNKSYTQ